MSYIGQAQSSTVLRNTTTITATAGQTLFPVYGGYALGFVDVFMNGLLLVPGSDFNANDGVNVTLLVGAASGDELMIVAYTPSTVVLNRAEVRQSFTATASQTTFTVTGGYTPGMLSVYLNGVKMVNGPDVTASNGSTVVFPVGLADGDAVDVVGLVSYSVADVVRKSGDAMTGDLDVMANIGVGTTTPNKGSVGRAVTLNTPSGGNIVEFCLNDSRIGWAYGDNNLTALAAAGNRRVSLQTNNEERLLIDGSGRVTMPFQPAFRATRSSGSANFAGNTTVIYDVVRVNRGNHYNASTGVFTAPVAGVYAFSFNYYTDNATSEMVDLVLNDTTIIGRTEVRFNAADNTVISSGMIMYPLAANDNVRVKNANTGNAQLIGGIDYNFFNGFLIG